MKKMMKITAGLSLVLAVAVVVFAQVAVPKVAYIGKAIETQSGVVANFWVAKGLSIQLGEEKQSAYVTMYGWLDKAAYEAGKEKLGYINITVDDVSALASYPAVMADTVGVILADPKFAGGVLKNSAE